MDGGDVRLIELDGVFQAPVGEQPRADALAQLGSRRLGEGHGDDALGGDNASAHPLAQALLDAVGLARARTGGDEGQLRQAHAAWPSFSSDGRMKILIKGLTSSA